MADRELARLSRKELLEMLIAQGQENEKLRQGMQTMQKKIDDRQIRLREAGTVAEAAFALSGVYEAADEAAKLYLENLERMSQEHQTEKSQILAETQGEANQILKEAREQSEAILQEAEAEKQRRLRAIQRAQDQLVERLMKLCEKYPGLRADLAELQRRGE